MLERRERVSKDWREEVRDILEESDFNSAAGGEPPRSEPDQDRARGPWLDAFGAWLHWGEPAENPPENPGENAGKSY